MNAGIAYSAQRGWTLEVAKERIFKRMCMDRLEHHWSPPHSFIGNHSFFTYFMYIFCCIIIQMHFASVYTKVERVHFQGKQLCNFYFASMLNGLYIK